MRETGVMQDFYVLLRMLVIGICAGLAYDGLRIFRNTCVHARWWRDTEDLVFWICVGLLSFDTAVRHMDGRIRPDWLAAAVAGGAVYELCLSKSVVKGGTFVLQYLTLPVKKLCFAVCRCIKWLKYHGKRGRIRLYGHFTHHRKKDGRGDRKHNGESRI